MAGLCRRLGIPIFLDQQSGWDPKIEGILSEAIILPRGDLIDAETYRLYRSSETLLEAHQSTVDYVAGIVGKYPEDIKMAFGGTGARYCVYAMATLLCRDVETNYKPPYPRKKSIERPIGYGRILDKIV
ncbi:MAG: hypothetical protein ISS48_01215 [Candidatus Aenigmarchaeota archaeon]|nr:hypothetical protein [Candidatus Aenigmarchaeota archaeon]